MSPTVKQSPMMTQAEAIKSGVKFKDTLQIFLCASSVTVIDTEMEIED